MKKKLAFLTPLLFILLASIVIAADTTVPNYNWLSRSILNNSDGSYIDVQINITDLTNESTGMLYIFDDSDTKTLTVNMSEDKMSVNSTNATATLRPDNFSSDGFYYYYVNATDNSSNVNQTGNQNITVNTLQANTWNLLSHVEANENMVTWATKVPSLSYISTLDNEYKNFTTFQVGTSTYNTSTVTKGYGVYVYPSSTVTLMRDWDASGGVSQDLKTNGWNLLGINDDQHTLQDVCDKDAKVSYVSYHNTTDDVYYSHKCDWNINNVTVDRGQGVWVLTTGNISVTI